ncbi:DUF839 domain-containing protein [Rhizobium bangladeshense]|uniref:DUF839 domain-containing protein n=1 Tax=Rhizobium bangladeshense TaxID=1138189 RepID=UPI0012E742E4|nr:DUF839 domain-containing protein [Rhizobium bangladeshense]
MPDTCAVDVAGRLWVSTDGNSNKPTGRTDGLWAVDTEGAARHLETVLPRAGRRQNVRPALFTPDDETAFVAGSILAMAARTGRAMDRPSYYEDVSARWPDFKPDMPVRPAVVAIPRPAAARLQSDDRKRRVEPWGEWRSGCQFTANAISGRDEPLFRPPL